MNRWPDKSPGPPVALQMADLRNPEILFALNNAAVPDVNHIDRRKADWLLVHSALARVASLDGRPAGVVVVLADTAGLDSEYFRWFTERYESFLYIDRVIVAAGARRRGVATRLYLEVDDLAQAGRQAIASEAYCEPPNVASLSLHRKMGYLEIGQQVSMSEGRTVAKFMKFGDRARPGR